MLRSSLPLCSGNSLECQIERRSEEEDDGEDTSSSSQEFEDVGLREEKAFSDSEIKVYIILTLCTEGVKTQYFILNPILTLAYVITCSYM